MTQTIREVRLRLTASAGQAARQLLRRPAQPLAVIAVAALSIGSCVAIFGMAKAVLLTDWMYRDAPRLGIIWHARANVPGYVGVSPGDYVTYKSSQLKTVASVAAVTTRGFNLGGAGTVSRVTCARMTAEMFPLLGVAPASGRWFSDAEENGAERVVVLSHDLWISRFGGDPAAIDREIILDAVPRRVVGIMPAGFSFPPEGIQGLVKADCWVPASFTPAELAVPAFNYVIVARLADHASWSDASQDAHSVAQRIWSTYPAAVQSQIKLTAHAVPLIEQATARSQTPLTLFAGSAICLLLIGCANVSNLLLTSFENRRHEMAVRASLGAPRTSLAGQLLAESLLLMIIGGIVGTALAAGLSSIIARFGATLLPRLADARVDLAGAAVAVTCGVIAGVVAGLAPALAVADGQLVDRGKSRGIARGLASGHWRRGLIALELALAVVVLVLAGVLARTVLGLNRVDPGFDPRGVVAFSVALPEAKYRAAGQVQRFRDGVLAAIESLPGLTNVAAGSALPIGESTPGVVVPAGSVSPTDFRPALTTWVTPGYARTLGMTVRAGRFFEPSDAATGNVVVLNETLARTLWPTGEAVGRSLMRIGVAEPAMVIGIAADVRQGGPLRPAAPAVYLPFADGTQPIRNLHFVANSVASSAAIVASIRRAVGATDPEIPVFAVRTGRELLDGTIAVQRFSLVMVGIFATFSIVLALSGLYAVLAQTVQAAYREFGIRQALGATRARILRLVLMRAMWPAAIGVAAGLAIAAGATGWVGSLLFGVQAADPIAMAAVAGLVIVASIASVLAPALRAARVDPATLLRSE